MTQNNQTSSAPAQSEDEKKPGFVTRFRTNHPRATKAIALTLGALVIGGGAYAAGSKKDNDSTATAELEVPFDVSDTTSSEA